MLRHGERIFNPFKMHKPKGATELVPGYTEQKQQEMLVFMKEAALDILKHLAELGKKK